ncbi:hypothetical protein KEM52_003409, partial [Ascosphaera acerosa]
RAMPDNSSASSSPPSAAFAAYLAYLYEYWQRPEYMQFLTHPEATLRSLRLLQDKAVRRSAIRPHVIELMKSAA